MNDNEIAQILQKANEAIETLQGAYEVMSALAEARKEEIESLQAQLAASQRREKAAVEQIEKFMVESTVAGNDRCDICAKATDIPCEECAPAWRGPQDEEGAEHERD